MSHPLTKYHFIDSDQLNRLVVRLESALAECESDCPSGTKKALMHYARSSGHAAGSIRCALITLTHLIDGAKMYPEGEEEQRQSSTTEVSDISAASVWVITGLPYVAPPLRRCYWIMTKQIISNPKLVQLAGFLVAVTILNTALLIYVVIN
jgi:hypothetical protein